jgi:hypothetical protein
MENGIFANFCSHPDATINLQEFLEKVAPGT